MDTGFHHHQTLSSSMNRHAISFQSNAMDSSTEMLMMMGDYHRMNTSAGDYNRMNSTAGMMFSGVAAEWSVEEQYKLEEGLSKYGDEPCITKYIKIAATLQDKSVRDVALRCRWMTRKRRKQDEFKLGKKLKDKKEMLVETSSKPSISSISTLNVAPFSVSMNNWYQSGGIPVEALSGSIWHLLEQNNHVLGQISANISSFKLQENADLFSHAKNNISVILNDMRYMPGPPLPISLNEDLANSVISATSQTMTFGSSSGMPLKQEPEYY